MTRIRDLPVRGGVPAGGYVVVTEPTGPDPALSVFAKVPWLAAGGDDVLNVRTYGAKGDGVTDDTAALTAAIATGLPLYFPPGTYLAGPLTVAQSLFGRGDASIIKAKPGTATTAMLISQNAAANATISDLVLDGANLAQFGIFLAGTNPQQTGLRFERLEIRNFGTSAATPSGLPAGINCQLDIARPASKRGIVVHDCYIHDIYGCGVQMSGTGCIVSGNVVVNTGSAGISPVFMIDGVVSHNTINNTGTLPAILADGITGYDRGNYRVLIIGNTINTAKNHGIHVGGNSIQIIGNKIFNVYNDGILLQSDPNGAPTPGANGIISGNEIDGVTANNGIQVGYFSGVTVTGNTVSNITSNHGIYIAPSPDCIVTGNIIKNTGEYGIYSSASANILIANNRIADTASKAIYDPGPSPNYRVGDNIITNEGASSAASRTIETLGGSLTNLFVNSAALISAGQSLVFGSTTPAAPANFDFRSGSGAPNFDARIAVNGGNGSNGNAGMTITANGGITINATGGVNSLATINAPGMTVGGNAVSNPVLHINGVKATTRYVQFDTAGSNRWRVTMNATDETGSNVGSDFQLVRYSDAAANLGAPLTIARSTGNATFGNSISAWNATPPAAKPAVTGSRGGNAAVASLLTALASYGFITDSSTA